MIVDHIDNKHETIYDNRLENLQLLTPAENLAKEKSESTKQLKCNMSKSLEYYENKLNKYLEAYEKEKNEHSSSTEIAHKLRSNIAQYRARIRYWQAHKEEYKNYQNKEKVEELAQKQNKERAQEIKELKEIVDKSRALYKADKSKINQYYWKLAIKNYNDYLKSNPFKKQENVKKALFVDLP